MCISPGKKFSVPSTANSSPKWNNCVAANFRDSRDMECAQISRNTTDFYTPVRHIAVTGLHGKKRQGHQPSKRALNVHWPATAAFATCSHLCPKFQIPGGQDGPRKVDVPGCPPANPSAPWKAQVAPRAGRTPPQTGRRRSRSAPGRAPSHRASTRASG